jgi:hypothetical protein
MNDCKVLSIEYWPIKELWRADKGQRAMPPMGHSIE